jgi:uncharacterized protein YoxC
MMDTFKKIVGYILGAIGGLLIFVLFICLIGFLFDKSTNAGSYLGLLVTFIITTGAFIVPSYFLAFKSLLKKPNNIEQNKPQVAASADYQPAIRNNSKTGFLDVFKVNKYKKELEYLKTVFSEIQNKEYLEIKQMTAELEAKKNSLDADINRMADILKIAMEYSEIQKGITELEQKRDPLNQEIMNLKNQIEEKKKEFIQLDEEVLLQSFALYKPKYEFEHSEQYAQKLSEIRDKQKAMIKGGTAATGSQDWTVNGSKSEGRKMVNDMIKLMLRSFNNECDMCVSNAKFNNIDSCEKKIGTTYDAVIKLGRIMNVVISAQYKKLKLEELYLAYEYQLKKQEEKEEQKRIKEQLREEARLQREIEEARRTIEKEQKHYNNALEQVKKQMEACKNETEKALLLEKMNEINSKLEEIDKNIKDIDYRAANQKAGYVYVISNIGAFGENIYKIGMTRRLEPEERIDELGDASVPFDFDVHVMIFSDDAPKLESALHKAFETRKINMINNRREFFNVSLDEIESVVKANHDKTVEFIKTADAAEYRQSLVMKKEIAGHHN